MCDYSAKSVRQRAAAKDDHLITRSISTHTRGFTSVSDPSTAVCVLPGTELAFSKPVEVDYDRLLGLYTGKKIIPHQVARFRQVEKDNEVTHHDALEFPDGTLVKLNSLVVGQTATVLQLPAAPKTDAEIEEQRRAAYV
jgi:hypothetical protein